jgi:hypothetical protein
MNANSEAVVQWLRQFRAADQSLALRLVRQIRTVDSNEFQQGLLAAIRAAEQSISGRIALFVEREVRKGPGKVPNRLFKQTDRKPRRAYGIGPPLIQPLRSVNRNVGSEGQLSTLATLLVRERPDRYILQPGPDEIRAARVRHFVILTDFIGSGERACDFLTAAWRVASVKSWHSLGLLRFHVVAYCATDLGRRTVERHDTKPNVNIALPCPTIATEFRPSDAILLSRLCIEYDLVDHNKKDSLGFGGVGALIVLGNSAPNNMPRIFHARGRRRKWIPLFPGRVATGRISRQEKQQQQLASELLLRMRQPRLSTSSLRETLTPDAQKLLLVMAALGRPPRTLDVTARRTGLTILEVEELESQCQRLGWLDAALRLTDAGNLELQYIRKHQGAFEAVESASDEPYYPTALRPPVNSA